MKIVMWMYMSDDGMLAPGAGVSYSELDRKEGYRAVRVKVSLMPSKAAKGTRTQRAS